MMVPMPASTSPSQITLSPSSARRLSTPQGWHFTAPISGQHLMVQ